MEKLCYVPNPPAPRPVYSLRHNKPQHCTMMPTRLCLSLSSSFSLFFFFYYFFLTCKQGSARGVHLIKNTAHTSCSMTHQPSGLVLVSGHLPVEHKETLSQPEQRANKCYLFRSCFFKKEKQHGVIFQKSRSNF